MKSGAVISARGAGRAAGIRGRSPTKEIGQGIICRAPISDENGRIETLLRRPVSRPPTSAYKGGTSSERDLRAGGLSDVGNGTDRPTFSCAGPVEVGDQVATRPMVVIGPIFVGGSTTGGRGLTIPGRAAGQGPSGGAGAKERAGVVNGRSHEVACDNRVLRIIRRAVAKVGRSLGRAQGIPIKEAVVSVVFVNGLRSSKVILSTAAGRRN